MGRCSLLHAFVGVTLSKSAFGQGRHRERYRYRDRTPRKKEKTKTWIDANPVKSSSEELQPDADFDSDCDADTDRSQDRLFTSPTRSLSARFSQVINFSSQALLQESQYCGFLRAQASQGPAHLLFSTAFQRLQHGSIQIGIDYHGVDVAFPADGRGVTKS